MAHGSVPFVAQVGRLRGRNRLADLYASHPFSRYQLAAFGNSGDDRALLHQLCTSWARVMFRCSRDHAGDTWRKQVESAYAISQGMEVVVRDASVLGAVALGRSGSTAALPDLFLHQPGHGHVCDR